MATATPNMVTKTVKTQDGVTLTLTDIEARTLYRLLYSHIVGQSPSRTVLDDIGQALGRHVDAIPDRFTSNANVAHSHEFPF